MVDYIFVHIPKTAGTSFTKGLEAVLGKKNIAYDYGASSKATSNEVMRCVYNDDTDLYAELESYTAISGHFSADKYRDVFPEARLLTFVRNPVERVWSEFVHIKSHYGYSHSFERFVKNPVNRNRMATCFGSQHIRDFEFIGLTEEYDRSLDMLDYMSGLCLPKYNINIMPGKKNVLSDEAREMVEELNSADIALYSAACNNFNNIEQGERVRGAVRITNVNGIKLRGWAVSGKSSEDIIVVLVCNGKRLELSAQSFRKDVMMKGLHKTGKCGFSVDITKLISTLGHGELKCFIKGSDIQLNGSPLSI